MFPVNTPRGEPIKHRLRRGFKSHNQPTEIKKSKVKPPNHYWEAATTESEHLRMCVCVCFCLHACVCSRVTCVPQRHF